MTRPNPTSPAPGLTAWLAARPALAPVLADAGARASMVAIAAGREAELVAVLELLDWLRVDAETLAATILFAIGSETAPDAIVNLIEGQREAAKVWALYAERGSSGGAEGLRRLLLSIIKDLRVVFILLATQLVRLRDAARLAESERRGLAQLTADIHAPLANRLGVWQLKWELEDLSFRYLQPENYRRIALALDERRDDRERFIEAVKRELLSALSAANIQAEVAGRPKHIWSIWKKMQRKEVELDGLYDIRAVRLLVADVATCYAALGVVHSLWPPVPGEFDDYIARPKGNHYQSLHTAVIGPGGKTLEIQIRSHEMHEHAELGVAAHWRYKEGGGGDSAFERRIAGLRQMLEAKADTESDAALLAGMETEVSDDRVYVLTPLGRVIDLPRGATVLDFAYSVHTDVGHRCRGAKLNGRLVPLDFAPASGDQVEIVTGKAAAPRRDWLIAGREFLTTSRAKEKVRAWFRKLDHARNIAAGKTVLERELKRVGLHELDLDPIPPRFNLKSVDELLVAVGIGEVSAGQIARALHELLQPKTGKPELSAEPVRARPQSGGAIVIEGVGNLLSTTARCCQPLPGDPISGYLTRGRGVSIHHRNCASLSALLARAPERIIQVEWGDRGSEAYEVGIKVRGYDRKGLLKDVSSAIAAADAHVLSASTRLDADHGLAEMQFVVRVHDFGQLSGLLNRVAALPNVIDARRLQGTEDRGQKTGDRGPGTEVRGPKTADSTGPRRSPGRRK
ncbi:MAG: bifunctional (p)ppGpp synthetase/guanosine-3',5'-bis(diphosphate) 3'-pyrophosphohydrolase [Lysobacterales bacterium]